MHSTQQKTPQHFVAVLEACCFSFSRCIDVVKFQLRFIPLQEYLHIPAPDKPEWPGCLWKWLHHQQHTSSLQSPSPLSLCFPVCFLSHQYNSNYCWHTNRRWPWLGETRCLVYIRAVDEQGGRRLCHPIPFLGAPWDAVGHSLRLHGTSCSLSPPTQDSHVPAACHRVILAGRPGSHSAC